MTQVMVSEKEVRAKKKRKAKPTQKRQGAASTTAKSKVSIKYTRLTGENVRWVAKTAIETGQTSTAVVNAAIQSIREGKKFSIDLYEPAYVKKMMASRERKIERLKAIAEA